MLDVTVTTKTLYKWAPRRAVCLSLCVFVFLNLFLVCLWSFLSFSADVHVLKGWYLRVQLRCSDAFSFIWLCSFYRNSINIAMNSAFVQRIFFFFTLLWSIKLNSQVTDQRVYQLGSNDPLWETASSGHLRNCSSWHFALCGLVPTDSSLKMDPQRVFSLSTNWAAYFFSHQTLFNSSDLFYSICSHRLV